MGVEYYAHSLKDEPPCKWHRLEDHLRETAERAREFAEPFGAGDWAYLAGLWHDVGKYSQEFQSYLKSQTEACAETQAGRVDHSTAGAQHLTNILPVFGHLLAYTIAGHHAGLLDGRAVDACQEKRLCKPVPQWKHALSELPTSSTPKVLPYLNKDPFVMAFFTRMIFSCLVDADFLNTERFLDLQKTAQRPRLPMIGELAPRFFQSLERLEREGRDKPINGIRCAVRLECERMAEEPSGFFSLTVPTGGGKTLSSLAFALRHAEKHDLRRIVYVAPFTTIIEQNAGVFRQHLGEEVVLEHHCNLDAEKESAAARLASENWDAPVIVTTSVQFYDSLFSNRTSRCRKLHRLARSVIVLDEAQTLPVDYLHPCLRALEELVRSYGSTVVLCTATQPEIRQRDSFKIGLTNVREIVSDPKTLYRKLKRVEVQRIGRKTDEELGARILKEERVLCIVNTTAHARLLFEKIGNQTGHFHLSARMCPAHRRMRLWQIRRALEARRTCRVISTQVVEAGVDLDFPVVFRAMAGLDSIAQAAGRCNRNGELREAGKTYVFTTEHTASERYFADTANCAAQVMELHPDPLALAANELFFRLYYWDQQGRWDTHHILDKFHLEQNRDFPFNFSFAQTARDFHLIDDAAYCTVIVPWGRKGRALCEKLRSLPAPNREILRLAQRYSVSIRRNAWNAHVPQDIHLVYDNLGISESPETHYNEQTGLNLEAEGPGSYFV